VRSDLVVQSKGEPAIIRKENLLNYFCAFLISKTISRMNEKSVFVLFQQAWF